MPERRRRLCTTDIVARLPLLAGVAFSARCARRVEPLFLRVETVSSEHKRVLRKAILVAESFAAGAATDRSHLYAAAAHAATTADVVAAHTEGIAKAKNAANAAHAAAHAAHAAASVAKITHVGDAASHAADAAKAFADAFLAAMAAISLDGRIAINNDFKTLLSRADNEKWTDDTPVSQEVFGELWPGAAPAFDLWIDPGSASKQTLQEILVALCELHIAAGGSGLEFIPDGGFVYVRQFEPV